YRFLSLLSSWIGWELSFDLPVPVWRNEIKSAPRLYSGIGTVPSIRALINRYSGWSTQVTEYAQHIVRSNVPSQQAIFSMTEIAAGWLGSDDVSSVLGFSAGNTDAGGTATAPASLTGTASPPFAVRPGSELSVGVDGNDAQTVRFGPSDFHNVHQATAIEVAATNNRWYAGLDAV